MNKKEISLYNVKEMIECRAPMEMDILLIVSIDIIEWISISNFD